MIRLFRKGTKSGGVRALSGFDSYELRLGDVMRGERATLGKSLLDIQRELRIKSNYIAAIEHADPSVFEAAGFIAGYVRTYARYLNIDPDWAFKRFCAESGFDPYENAPAETGVVKMSNTPRIDARYADDPFGAGAARLAPRKESFLTRVEPGALGSMAALLCFVTALGYGSWMLLQDLQRVNVAPIDDAPDVVAQAPTLGVQAPQEDAVSGPDVALLTPDAGALDRLYRPEALDVPVIEPRDGPIAALDPARVGALVVPEVKSGSAIDLASASSGTELTDPAIQLRETPFDEIALVAVEASWVRVRGADGAVLFEKIMNAGERFVLPALEQAPELRAGNAGGIYFDLGGSVFGPAGENGTVVSGLALSSEALTESFTTVQLADNAEVCEAFQVASADQSFTCAR